ncbi:adhesin [Mycoplasma sp. 1654_15]|uniref:adhesin n=1 Tax=Mycoplasma sp. 1654_15 TaxID=2725994 RepID=UPI0015800434|nr:adhesin [Mycoplasma sp. 1654_15]QJB71591.2 hypothetical protein HF996_03165 [Mycoplasma sp. 1654_15]
MKQQNKSFKKKALAIVSLAIAGASLGSIFLIPYLIKNWKGIQYKVIDLKQDFDNLTTDKAVNFSFELADQDAYDLEYADLNVHLVDEQGNKVVSTKAKYDYFSRKYNYVQPESASLAAGSRYYVQVEAQNNFYKNRKIKKLFTFSENTNNFVTTKASVKSFTFNNISNKEAHVIVDFNDSINSLDNKKVALQYHYINTNISQDGVSQELSVKTKNLSQESITSYVDSATVANQKAIFVIKNLTPNRKYVIESVKLIEQLSPDSFASRKIDNLYNHLSEENRSFDTHANTVWVDSITASDIDDYSKTLLLSFDENDDNKTSLEGKKVKLQYSKVDPKNPSPKLFTLDSVIRSKIAEFKLDSTNSQNTLEPGTKYRVEKVFVTDAYIKDKNANTGIEFKLINEKQREFSSSTQITDIQFDKVSTSSANINITFASALDPDLIVDQEASLSLSPISGKKITALVKKDASKTNIYHLNFQANDLFQKTEYFVDSVKLLLKNNQVVYFDDTNTPTSNDQPNQPISVKKILFDKNLENTKDAKRRSFTTHELDVEVFIKSFPESKINSVEYNIGFTPLFSWLNGHKFILKYKQLNYTGSEEGAKDGFGPIISSSAVEAKDYNIKFSLIEFKDGVKYQLDSIHLADDPQRKIELIFDPNSKQNDLSSNQFATKIFVKSIDIKDLKDTSATVKLVFGDYTKSLLNEQLQNKKTRNVKLLYESKDTVVSNDFADTEVKEENGEIVAEFKLNNLQKKTTYEIKNVYLDPLLVNFTDITIKSLPNNSFTTPHKQVIIATAKVNDIMPNSATVDVSFDLGANLFLADKKLKLLYQKENDSTVFESEATTVGLGLNTSFKIKDLEAGSKYKLVNVKVDESQTDIADTKFVFKTNDPNTQTEFYTYLGVGSFQKEILKQDSIDILVKLENSDPKTKDIKDAILVYQRLSDQTIFTQKQNSYDQNNKTLKFELKNLTKFTDYKILDVAYNFQNLVWNKNINKDTSEDIKWKTLAEDAKIINIYQNVQELTSVGVSLNFNNFSDAYLYNDKIKIKLKKTEPADTTQNLNSNAVLEKEVQINSDLTADFTFDNLDPGSTYVIEQMSDVNKPDLRLHDWNQTKLYTKSQVKNFEFSEIKQNSAKVKINFSDSENFYDQKQIQVFYKQVRTGNIFSVTSDSNNKVSNHSITIELKNLEKYSEYVIENVLLVSDAGNTPITISEQAKTNQAFATIVSEINLVDVKVDKINTDSAHISVIFDSNIDFYLDNKQVKIVFAAKNQNTNRNWTETKDVTITNKNGIYQAETNLTNLEEGAQFEIKSFEVGIEKITPTSNLQPTTLADSDNVLKPIFKLDNKEWNQQNISTITQANFATHGVISQISTENLIQDSANVKVKFKNLNSDSAQVFNTHSATLSFNGPDGVISATATINNNEATFSFSNLSKLTQYSSPSLIIKNVNNPQREVLIPFAKEYDNLNQQQNTKTFHIKDFTTTFTSVSITSFEYEKISTTENRLTFEFDRLVDYLINDKKVKLVYRIKGTNQQSQPITTDAIKVSDSTVSFDLKQLNEGSEYEVEKLEVEDDKANNISSISVNTSQVFTNTNNKNIFFTQSVISTVSSQHSYSLTSVDADTKRRVQITLSDSEGRFKDTNLKDKTKLELISQHSNNIIEVKPTSFTNSTLEFELTNLDKLSEYHINTLFINNEVIPWAHNLNSSDPQMVPKPRVFKTTANEAKLVSVTQTDSSAHKAVVNIQFDPQKDYFLLGNAISVKFKKTSGNASQNQYVTKQVTIDNEGIARVEIDKEKLAQNPINTDLTAGAVYKIDSIDFHDITTQLDTEKLVNTKISLETYIPNSSDVTASTLLSQAESEFRTQPIVQTLESTNLENSSGNIDIQINSEDTALTSKYAWITYQSQKDNSIIVRLKSNQQISLERGQYKANFNLSSLKVLERYKVLNVKLGDDQNPNARASGLEIDQQIDQQNKREFYTKPTRAIIQDIKVNYPDARGTQAVVDIKFDDVHDTYLNGSSATITYERIDDTGQQIGNDITHKTTLLNQNFQIINSSVKFTLTGDTTQSDTQKVVLVENTINSNNKISKTNTVKDIGTSTTEWERDAPKSKLVEGTRYRIKKIELEKPSADLQKLHFEFKQDTKVTSKKINETTLIEPLRISTYDYKIQVNETPTAVNTKIAVYYSTSYDLNDQDKSKFDLYVKNLSTNEVEIISAANTITKLSPSDNDGNYRVEFELTNKKASIYRILSTTYNDQTVLMSSYLNPEQSQANIYTTPASKSKVKELKYLTNSQLEETKATVIAFFDDTNEDLTRAKRRAILYYKEKNSNQTKISTEVEIKENKAEFKLGESGTGLNPNTDYIVEKIKIETQLDFNKDLQDNNLDTQKFAIIANENDSEFNTSIQPNDKNFETKAQFQTAFSAQSENSATVTLRFKNPGQQIQNQKTAYIVFAESSLASNNQNDIFQESQQKTNLSFGNISQNTLAFNLKGLKKGTLYKIQKVIIDNIEYNIEQSATSTFSTILSKATVTNIDYKYSEFSTTEASQPSQANNVKAKFRVYFQTVDNFLNNQYINVKLQTKTASLSDQSQQNQNINKVAQVQVDNTGLVYADVEFTNTEQIKAATEYSISEIQILNSSSSTDLKQGVQVEGISRLTKDFYTITNIQSFDAAVDETSAELVFKLNSKDRQISNTPVILNLRDNNNVKYYSQVIFNNTTNEIKFSLSHLDKLKEYTIESLQFSKGNTPVNIAFMPNVSKTFKTIAKDFEIKDIVQVSNTDKTVKLKLTFNGDLDKYLLNKQIKLKYQEFKDGQEQGSEKTSKTIATIRTPRSVVQAGPKTFEAEFELQNNDVTDGTRYKIHSVELVDKNLKNNSNTVLTSRISDDILKFFQHKLFFETKVSQPKLKSITMEKTTNEEGEENTYIAPITLEFFDKNNALAKDKIGSPSKGYIASSASGRQNQSNNGNNARNAWNFEFWTDNKEQVTFLDNVEVTHDNSAKTTKVKIFMKGSAKKWVKTNQKIQQDNSNSNSKNKRLRFTYSYYEDLDRTSAKSVGSLTSDVIHTYANAQSTSAQNSDPLFIDSPDKFVLEKSYGRFLGDARFIYSLEVYDPNKIIQNVNKEDNPQVEGKWQQLELYSTKTPINQINKKSRKVWQSINEIKLNLLAKKSVLNFRGLSYDKGDYSFNYKNANLTQKDALDIPTYTNTLDTSSEIDFKYKYENNLTTDLYIVSNVDPDNANHPQEQYTRQVIDTRINTYLREVRSSSNADFKTIDLQIGPGTGNPNQIDKVLSKILSVDFNVLEIKNNKILFAKNSSKFINTFQTPFAIGTDAWWFGSAVANTGNNASLLNNNYNILGLTPNVDTDQSNNKNFGIEQITYNKDNDTVEVKYHREQDSKIQTAFPEVAYASFINQKGDLYFFGGKDGRPLSYRNDYDYTNETMTFYLRPDAIPYEQRPKHGEILSFVGVVVIPYLGEGTPSFAFTVEPNGKKGEVMIKASNSLSWTIDFRKMYLTNFVKSDPIYKSIKIGFDNWI